MIKFPVVVKRNIGKDCYRKWNKYYNKKIKGRDCFKEEGLWRRSQEEINKKDSGWTGPQDKRRRIIHYEHDFGAIKRGKEYQFVLRKVYLWISFALPEREFDEYFLKIKEGLEKGSWKRQATALFRFGELFLEVKEKKGYREDCMEKRVFPRNYKFLDITVYSINNFKKRFFTAKPWLVIKGGIRKKDVREDTFTTKDLNAILNFLPAQVELGGGASIEAGVYPLHFLHKIYSVCDEDKRFIFSYDKDEIVKDI